MTLIGEIKELAACIAWCPLQSHSDFIVTGTKDAKGAGFEDTGGELQIHRFELEKTVQTAVSHAVCPTSSRFRSLIWTCFSRDGEAPLGLIVGGMVDGVIHVWNAQQLLENHGSQNEALLCTLKPSGQSYGPVVCLGTSPLEPWQLAIGTSHGQVFLCDLSMATPSLHPAARHAGEVSCVAWNSQVNHICASACSTDGSLMVWDTKSQKPWCECRTNAHTTHLTWNPQQGLVLLTADGPVVHVWDLAASTALPVAQLQAGIHTDAILQMDWCPHDDTLLLTTAKDGCAYLWDLRTLQALAALPNENVTPLTSTSQPAQASSLFAAASTPSHVRTEVHWSPHIRGLVLSCRLDKHVQLQSLPALPRPPAWLARRGAVASFGFGATLATCDATRCVTLRVVPGTVDVATRALAQQHQTTTLSPRDTCLALQAAAKSSAEAALWGFLRVLFESNARQALLEYLGYAADEISAAIEEFSDNSSALPTVTVTLPELDKRVADELIEQALVVGNFQAAVDACLTVHNFADALLLASCGGAELWTATQSKYLDIMMKQQGADSSLVRPYLPTVSAIMHSNMTDLVAQSDLANWQMTLALLATYGASQDFATLCQALGQRLEEVGQSESAALVYICAMDFDSVVSHWHTQLCSCDVRGEKGADELDDASLHDFCTKVLIMQQACPSATLPEAVAGRFSIYAKRLADDGYLVAAASYARDGILQDRLYRSRLSALCLQAMHGTTPAFPYQIQDVQACRGVVSLPEQRAAAEQARLSAEHRAKEEAERALAQESHRQRQEEARRVAALQHAAGDSLQQQQAVYAEQTRENPVAGTNGYAQSYSSHQTSPSLEPSANNELPAGWMALQDPHSGREYYYNQTTGETTWDRPAPASPQTAAALPETFQTPSKAKQTLASKYGDGFVSSASDPKLAYQYGNVGTSNPYHGSDRPGTAAAAVGHNQAAPVSETFNVDNLELAADLVPLRDSLVDLVEHLKSLNLSAADRRQFSDGEKAVAVFCKKLARHAVHDESLEHAKVMVNALVSGDFRTATSVQTTLVNSDWREHKDWLKGFKSLIQLSSRKL